ncbi:hypothetical protein [Desulfobulbus sp.]|uniref:hypothetical protein n=1 Tax=Desulfobulbus sp. TaxID=895 RepID=UPI00286F4C85|nr:hypothetical protein [Desulfobulbus sp.]
MLEVKVVIQTNSNSSTRRRQSNVRKLTDAASQKIYGAGLLEELSRKTETV